MTSSTGVECELKLALAPDDYLRLRDSLPGRLGEVTQRNLFLDTADGQLAAGRWALRVRRERSAGEPPRVIVAVKGPAARVAGALRRVELEADADDSLWQRALAGSLAADAIDGPPGDFLRRELSLRPPLPPVLEFTNLRTTFGLDLAGAPRLLELDRTQFATGEVDHELELELKLELELEIALSEAELVLEVKAVSAALEALLADHGVRATPSAGGKYSRALRYAGSC
jgi:inorganic triphosphatase YgiF